MLKYYILILFLAILSPSVSFCEDKQLQQSDITYLGAFKVPNYWSGSDQYSTSYAQTAIAYNQANNSLFLSNIYGMVTEISIPQPVSSGNLSNLNTSAFVSPYPYFYDLTNGNMSKIGVDGAVYGGSTYIRGLYVKSGYIYGATKAFYDGAYDQDVSHWRHSADLTDTSSWSGYYKLGSWYPGPYAGYMCNIPEAYQSALGGDTLAGHSWYAIATSTSFGPAAEVFNVSDIGGANKNISATRLVAYDGISHAMFGDSDTYYYQGNQPSNDYTGTNNAIGGMFWPNGTKSILYIGRHQKPMDGYACYGYGKSSLSESYSSGPPYLFANRLSNCGESGNENCCYDPKDAGKGVHGYPYTNYIWSYSSDDLIAVKNGTKNYYDIAPNAVWDLGSLPTSGGEIVAATFDASNNKIYGLQQAADEARPVIHVFSVNAGGGSSISGLCGFSNGLSLSSTPVTGLCSAGTASTVSGTGPWAWTCAGSGGSTDNCSASLATQSHTISVKLGGGKMTGILR